jgi:hypothetical protein
VNAVKGFDDALGRAIAAANTADEAARDYEAIDDEHPQFASFTSYYRDRSAMYAQVAQSWAAIAQALSNEEGGGS